MGTSPQNYTRVFHIPSVNSTVCKHISPSYPCEHLTPSNRWGVALTTVANSSHIGLETDQYSWGNVKSCRKTDFRGAFYYFTRTCSPESICENDECFCKPKRSPRNNIPRVDVKIVNLCNAGWN